MKRDRQAEGEQLLKDGEAELRRILLEVLPGVVESGSMLFTNSEFNPSHLPEHRLSKVAEALLENAKLSVTMRKALALPVTGSVGHLYLAACEEYAGSDEQRRGPRKLAAALLEHLKKGA